ncbi:MAG: polysaccharide biosynthesis/export family protein, partial [Fidelibacterota bacterium]
MNRTLLLIFVITLNGFGQTFQFYDDVEQDQIEPQSMEFIQNPILQDKIILEEPVDPRTYIVGPGDTFSFNMVSADGMVNLLLEVSPIGDVLVPVVGLISVKDLSLTEAFEQIKSQCLMKYSNASVYLTLTKIRQFKVLITGTVNHPGFIVVNPFIRVSDVMERVFDGSEGSALIFSDQPMDKISLRNIKLSRGDQIIRVDLIKFNMTGNLDLNPRVAAGDVISIGMSNGNTR